MTSVHSDHMNHIYDLHTSRHTWENRTVCVGVLWVIMVYSVYFSSVVSLEIHRAVNIQPLYKPHPISLTWAWISSVCFLRHYEPNWTAIINDTPYLFNWIIFQIFKSNKQYFFILFWDRENLLLYIFFCIGANFFAHKETLVVHTVWLIFYRETITEIVTFLIAVWENASGWLWGLSISVQVTVSGLLRVIEGLWLDSCSAEKQTESWCFAKILTQGITSAWSICSSSG